MYVHWVTLFLLETQAVTSLKQLDLEQFEGIVGFDEIYFLYSKKGQHGIADRRV